MVWISPWRYLRQITGRISLDTDAAGIIHLLDDISLVEATEEALFRHLKLPF
jgi:hypothetical protein